ncbi:MAG: hypothetical protein DMG40_17130 [Acidobacteria bacterium]|nr:MAG: hypothetical protein DMG40_17130 [Acidobacteriota bacterium]
MNLFCCTSEMALEATLRQGRWPHACDPDLRAHVDGCRDCQELVLIAQALQRARSNREQPAGLHLARVSGSPGLLWWRAQLRRRKEAIQRVSEPVSLAEKVGFVGLLAAFLVAIWQWGRFADLLSLFQSFSNSGLSELKDFWAASFGASFWMTVLGVAALGALVFFATLAVFLLKDET